MREYLHEFVLYPSLLYALTNNCDNVNVKIPRNNKFAVNIINNKLNKLVKIKIPFGSWWLIPFFFLL